MVTMSLRRPPDSCPLPRERAMPAADGGIGCAARRLALSVAVKDVRLLPGLHQYSLQDFTEETKVRALASSMEVKRAYCGAMRLLKAAQGPCHLAPV